MANPFNPAKHKTSPDEARLLIKQARKPRPATARLLPAAQA